MSVLRKKKIRGQIKLATYRAVHTAFRDNKGGKKGGFLSPWVSPSLINEHILVQHKKKTIDGKVRPRGTRPLGTRTLQIHGFDMGPKIFQL